MKSTSSLASGSASDLSPLLLSLEVEAGEGTEEEQVGAFNPDP
jgi:hypothetical protein